MVERLATADRQVIKAQTEAATLRDIVAGLSPPATTSAPTTRQRKAAKS